MNIVKLIAIFISSLIMIYFIVKAIIEPPFEKLNREYINLIDYAIDEAEDLERRDYYRDGDFRIESVFPTKNRRSVYSLDEKYWVFWTGVVSLDSGAKYFYTPTYSRLIVVNRDTNEILSNKIFFRDVTNAKIIDGYIYFVYSSFANYKLGRYKLND